MDELAIVGIFFDDYIDLWRDFFGALKHNWPDCPYRIYVVDNDIQLTEKDTFGLKVTVLNAGKDSEYSRKVQMAVENVSCKYMLLLLEDFYFSDRVDNSKMEEIINTIKANDIDYYTMPMPEFIGNKEKEKYKNLNIKKISKDREYIFSCQPSIWNKDLLKLCIGNENYNAWVFEGIYAKSPCVRRNDFLDGAVIDYSNPLNLRHGALQGKMIPSTVKAIRKSGYKMTTDRKQLSLNYILKHRIKKLGHRLVKIPLFSFVRVAFRNDSVLEKYKEEILTQSKRIIDNQKIDAYLEMKSRQRKSLDKRIKDEV